jgi:hypothetical protein
MSLSDDERRMGAEFLGYGDPSAPCWFMGPEPGGKYDPAWATFWAHELGAPAIFDPRRDPDGKSMWFSDQSPLQRPTWRAVIETLLAYDGVEPGEPDDEILRGYQIEQFGRRVTDGGQACIVELSAFAAKNQDEPSPYRHEFLSERIVELKRLLAFSQPQFVVFYGASYRSSFEEIAGLPLTVGSIVKPGQTMFTLAYHPAAERYGRRTDFRAVGRSLRATWSGS